MAGCPARPKPITDNRNRNVSNPTSLHAHTNRLAREKSPYLLQHQHNPVDWYAWGDEAFDRARKENKPIFLSIGYSTCHWCHVMERESFEDRTLAAFLNDHFVAIKVDREERPDVDKIYMTFVQAISGQGGWPLNVFLTPALKPFYGGTYFPPNTRAGRPGFLQLLQQIHQLWENRQSQLVDSAEDLHNKLRGYTEQQAPGQELLTTDFLHNAARVFKREYDPKHGGFGGAPKFPRPSQPSFLLRYSVRFHDDEALRMVLHTCERMAAGGMRDQLGGGFARYSVDAEWLVPHFEKMLYDNAQLINLYLDAWLVSGNAEFAEVARDTIGYVLRDMTHPEGGFYSAEDADSEGKEGKFYCWTESELSTLLTTAEFNAATRYFGITTAGNFVDHSDPHPLPNQNVLSIAGGSLSDADKILLDSAKRKMFESRSKRIRPQRDDKILSSWNGLMLGALARAYAILGDERYRRAAESNLAFLRARLWLPPTETSPDGKLSPRLSQVGTLYHRWRDGERDSVQLLDAYAFLLAGVLDLYEATVEPGYLDFAISLAESMLVRFHDSESGGFWQSPEDAADLIVRVKEDYDGAEPSGNSVAVLALLRIAAITDRKEFRQAAEGSLRLFSSRLEQLPQAVPFLLHGLDYWLGEPVRAVIVGAPRSDGAKSLIQAVHSVYQPNKVVLGNTGAVEPFARTLPQENGPIAFLCTGNACQPPVKEPALLKKLMSNSKSDHDAMPGSKG